MRLRPGRAAVGVDALGLEPGEQPQGLGVALEAADAGRDGVEGGLAVVAERRVPEVVREAGGVDDVGVCSRARRRSRGRSGRPRGSGSAGCGRSRPRTARRTWVFAERRRSAEECSTRARSRAKSSRSDRFWAGSSATQRSRSRAAYVTPRCERYDPRGRLGRRRLARATQPWAAGAVALELHEPAGGGVLDELGHPGVARLLLLGGHHPVDDDLAVARRGHRPERGGRGVGREPVRVGGRRARARGSRRRRRPDRSSRRRSKAARPLGCIRPCAVSSATASMLIVRPVAPGLAGGPALATRVVVDALGAGCRSTPSRAPRAPPPPT